MMPEELLQYIWKHGLFEKDNLKTTSNEMLEILAVGTWNTDSGPDFFNASLKINGTLWAGNVEIHLKASDWYAHGHNSDKAYDNVILHVVLENDQTIFHVDGSPVPVFVPQIVQGLEQSYKQLMAETRWPACHSTLPNIDPIYKYAALSSVLVQRINNKAQRIVETLKRNKNDWNETFYQHLAQNFGFKTNALPFELLARSLPLKILSKYKHDLFKVEALLFGQSGMLNDQLLGDDYFIELRNEYSYLAKLHKLRGIESHLWKYMRLRPANFPTIRLAQFARLIHRSESLFSKLLEMENTDTMIAQFDVATSDYWKSHYKFNTPSKHSPKQLGESARNNPLINTVAPFFFIFGDRSNKQHLKNRALEILERIEPENNSIIDRWKELGFEPLNAFDTQALIELKTNFCDAKKCLHCQLGSKIIRGQK